MKNGMGGGGTKMDEAKTRRKWPKVGCSLTRLQSRTAEERDTVWRTSGVVEEKSHTPPRNHRQHNEGLNFIATCSGNEWAVAGPGCVTLPLSSVCVSDTSYTCLQIHVWRSCAPVIF